MADTTKTGFGLRPAALQHRLNPLAPGSRSACPMMDTAPRAPVRTDRLALAAARPCTNSPRRPVASPRPVGAVHRLASMNTVERTLWPLLISAANFIYEIALVGECVLSKVPEVVMGVQIGRSGSRVRSCVSASHHCRRMA